MASEPPSEPPGDSGSFAEIVERHVEYLRGVARRLAGSPDIANDLVQETLFRAFGRFARFEQGTNARAWLVTILMRRFYDHLKHDDVVNRAVPELLLHEDNEDEDDLTLLSIPDDYLYAAIRALEPEVRRLVELCYLHEMRRRDVAGILGVPAGTIASRLSSARRELKVLLIGMILKAGKP